MSVAPLSSSFVIRCEADLLRDFDALCRAANVSRSQALRSFMARAVAGHPDLWSIRHDNPKKESPG